VRRTVSLLLVFALARAGADGGRNCSCRAEVTAKPARTDAEVAQARAEKSRKRKSQADKKLEDEVRRPFPLRRRSLPSSSSCSASVPRAE